MELWQAEAAGEMKSFIEEFYETDGVALIGSAAGENPLDAFSDVDMEIKLPRGAPAPTIKNFYARPASGSPRFSVTRSFAAATAKRCGFVSKTGNGSICLFIFRKRRRRSER